MKELKDCTRRARFKICALATACTGLVEIQTLRSVYETQIKKTVQLSGKRFIPLDKFEKRAQKDFFMQKKVSSLSSIVLKFRTHQEEKTYDSSAKSERKEICLLNTDLRSVSKAALRKLWHSNKRRFWNAPIEVLLYLQNGKFAIYLVHSRLDDDKMCVGGVFFVTWLRRGAQFLLKSSGVGGEGVSCVLLDRVLLEQYGCEKNTLARAAAQKAAC